MARPRMYQFERAYVDYAAGFRGFVHRIRQVSADIWHWFWRGEGSVIIEWLLRAAIVTAALGAAWMYWSYEQNRGRGFSSGMVVALLAIIVFVSLILIGYKAPVHVVARLLSGTSASGLALALMAVAALVATAIFVPYLLILFLLTALSFLVFIPLRGLHAAWLLHRRITYRCPYDDCAYSGMPIHVCSCGEQYADLMPSFYGLLHHSCRKPGHYERLPTMDWWGRNKLPRLCGGCKRPLVFSSIGEVSIRPISLVGGPNAGKTIFLHQAVHQLQGQIGSLRGGTARIDSDQQKKEHEDALQRLGQGQVLPKTSGNVMHALGLTIRVPHQLRCLLYLYDAPGEHFSSVESFAQKQNMQHISGILLIVDPYSLPAIADVAARRPASPASTIQPTIEPFQRVVDVLVQETNLMLVRQPTERCKVPLAILLSKTDDLPVKEFPFLAGLTPANGHTSDAAFSSQCREALANLGARSGLETLERKFTTVRYFACSALGRPPDHTNIPFKPVGVAEPLLWLLGLEQGQYT
jgi:hypothetical protein